MVSLDYAEDFWRGFCRLPTEIQERARTKLKLFVANRYHPSLRLKRVRGTPGLWEISVNMQYRIIFEFVTEDHALLLRIGTHKVIGP